MSNSFESFPSFPDEGVNRPDMDVRADNLAGPESTIQRSESGNDAKDSSLPERSDTSSPELNDQNGEGDERTFEQTRETDEHRDAALAELERRMHEMRKDFAETYIEDQTQEVENYFNADLSQAENGALTRTLLHQMTVDRLKRGMADFIETGNRENMPILVIRLRKAMYSFQGSKKMFLTGISINSEESNEGREYRDLRPELSTAKHRNAA